MSSAASSPRAVIAVGLRSEGRGRFFIIAFHHFEPLRQVISALIRDDKPRIQLNSIAQIGLIPAVIRRSVLLLVAIVINIGGFISKGLFKPVGEQLRIVSCRETSGIALCLP